MLRIKQHKFIWFGIIVLGVILLGIPAAVYAEDGVVLPDPVADEANFEDYDYDADSENTSYSLGETTEDFVFTPIKPCRIIDTREAGGSIGSGSTRSFYVRGANLSAQGGNSAGCNSPVGEPLAVLMNIVAVNSIAPGYLTVWPYGTTRPLAGVLNYSPTARDPISNAFTVKSSGATGLDISVYALSQTHVVADVMGYYSRPGATALQTVELTNTVSVANGANYDVFSPYCTSGYTMTGGGCAEEFGNTARVIHRSQPYGTRWLCKGINYAGTQNVTAHIVCARVPGR